MFKILWKSGCLTKIIIVVVTVITVILVQNFPIWLSSKLLPAIAQSAGVAGVEANVHKLGLTGAELHNAKIRIEGKKTVSAEIIKTNYRLPLYPFKRQIKVNTLLVYGLKVNIVEENGTWKIPGIYPELFDNLQKKPAKVKSENPSEPVVNLERLILRNCEILIEKDGHRLKVPFSGRINLPQDLNRAIRINITFQFSGDDLNVVCNWYRKTKIIEMESKGSLRFDNYAIFLPLQQRQFFGETKFTAKLSGNFPKNLTGSISFPKLVVGSPGWRVGTSHDTPAMISYTQLSANYAEFSLDGLNIYRPVNCKISPMGGFIGWSPELLTLQGSFRSTFPKQKNELFNLKSNLPIDHQINMQWSPMTKKGEWHYGSTISDTDFAKVIDGQFEKIELSSSGKINGSDLEMMNEIIIQPSFQFNVNGVQIEAAEPIVSAALKNQEGVWSGFLTLNSQKISLPHHDLKTGKLAMEYPIFTSDLGFLELNHIQYRQHQLEQLKYQIKNDGKDILLDGNIKQDLLPAVDISSQIKLRTLPQLAFMTEVKIRTAQNAKSVNLGKFSPALDGMNVNGNISMDASYGWHSEEQSGNCKLTISDGSLSNEKLNLNASGIEAQIIFPSLPHLNSSPNQYLICKNLKFKTYDFENIRAAFSIDRDSSFLLENFGLNWCGGRIFTYSLRFTPETKNINSTIYLDGLNISQIINQTGLAQAKGSGAIYGRVPLQVGADGINIQPGFLYSVPGKTSNLKIEGLEDKLSAIPKETAQFAQLDLAAEALKDFNYEWIKVDFDNDGENLVIKSQFNGRPVKPLPFTYDEKSGRIIRMEGAKANFQGINLDLNTTLPLNQLLNFNQTIKKLFGGKKK